MPAFTRKRIFGAAVVAGLAVLAALSMRPQPVLLEIGQPERRAVREYVAEEAKTRLRDEYVVDMPVTGTLNRVSLEVGDLVTAGDVVARVDGFDLEQRIRGVDYMVEQARAQIVGLESGKPKSQDRDTAAMRVRETADQLAMAEKGLRVAEIDAAQADRDRARVEGLAGEGVVAQQELDRATQAWQALSEEVERARLATAAARKNVEIAQLAASRVDDTMDDNEYLRQVYGAEIQRLEAERAILVSDLEKANVRAPVSGPVLERYVESSRVLAAGTPILKLGDLATMEIESDVLSEEVVAIRPGNAVELIGKALGEELLEGRVDRIYPAAFMKISSLGIEQQRVKTIIAFDNSELQLRPGTRLDVRIITRESPDGLAVPERAIFRREGAWHVFVVDGGRAELREVEVGLKNDTWAEILGGLEAGESVILEPRNDLEPGTRVAPR